MVNFTLRVLYHNRKKKLHGNALILETIYSVLELMTGEKGTTVCPWAYVFRRSCLKAWKDE